LKPAEVARKLRVSVDDVYRANKRLKVNYAKALKAGQELGTNRLEYFYKHQTLGVDRPEVKEAVADYVDTHGLKDLTRAKVIAGIEPSLQGLRVHP
jgi:hypothetical protein